MPPDTPDLRGYVELALESGYPTAALVLSGRARRLWLQSYLQDLLTHDVEVLEQPATKRRDTERLRRYFEAYALNSAGVADHKTIFDAAGVTKVTAVAYEELLARLLVVDRMPAWTSNRLKRLVRTPKRYVVDAGLIGAALRLDTQAVLDDGDLLGRILDTFAVAQIRPETVMAESEPRLHHLRTEAAATRWMSRSNSAGGASSASRSRRRLRQSPATPGISGGSRASLATGSSPR